LTPVLIHTFLHFLVFYPSNSPAFNPSLFHFITAQGYPLHHLNSLSSLQDPLAVVDHNQTHTPTQLIPQPPTMRSAIFVSLFAFAFAAPLAAPVADPVPAPVAAPVAAPELEKKDVLSPVIEMRVSDLSPSSCLPLGTLAIVFDSY
jgi:hypothetical protein